jgi:hypothetical protein
MRRCYLPQQELTLCQLASAASAAAAAAAAAETTAIVMCTKP